MGPKLRNLWENARSSLWFLPSVLVALALSLSSLLIEVDVLLAERQSKIIPWLFSGTADAARTLLSVIAGSLITVISIAFSLTFIALQQASTQFTPRILRNFTSSRVNQLVLGSYIATFIYALMVLRTVRNENQGNPFVPALSVTLAVGLALVCLGLLIYFIHHTSQSLQVSVIVDQIRRDIVQRLDELYPSQIGERMEDPGTASELVDRLRHGSTCFVRATTSGFVRHVDEETLLEIPFRAVEWVWVRPSVGEFVPRGGILAELAGVDPCSEETVTGIQNAIVLDAERSLNQDPLFGIRQLVDIALKALSPGINDPTTAAYVLYHLGAVLGDLADREFPSSTRTTADGRVRLLLTRPSWNEYVDEAFSQIRREAQDDVHVTGTLLKVLALLAERVVNDHRALVIHRQVAEIRQSVQQQDWSAAEQQHVERLANEVGDTLRESSTRIATATS